MNQIDIHQHLEDLSKAKHMRLGGAISGVSRCKRYAHGVKNKQTDAVMLHFLDAHQAEWNANDKAALLRLQARYRKMGLSRTSPLISKIQSILVSIEAPRHDTADETSLPIQKAPLLVQSLIMDFCQSPLLSPAARWKELGRIAFTSKHLGRVVENERDQIFSKLEGKMGLLFTDVNQAIDYAKHKKLAHLDLSGMQVTATHLRRIKAEVTSVQSLDLSYTRVSADTVCELAESSVNLLNLTGCTTISAINYGQMCDRLGPNVEVFSPHPVLAMPAPAQPENLEYMNQYNLVREAVESPRWQRAHVMSLSLRICWGQGYHDLVEVLVKAGVKIPDEANIYQTERNPSTNLDEPSPSSILMLKTLGRGSPIARKALQKALEKDDVAFLRQAFALGVTPDDLDLGLTEVSPNSKAYEFLVSQGVSELKLIASGSEKDQWFSALLDSVNGDLDAVLPDGHPLLHRVIREGTLSQVLYLLQKGVNVNIADSLGNSPLHCAVTRPEAVNAVKPLLEAGANPNFPNHKGETPFHHAVVQEEHELFLAGYLLHYGANPNVADDRNETPYDWRQNLVRATRSNLLAIDGDTLLSKLAAYGAKGVMSGLDYFAEASLALPPGSSLKDKLTLTGPALIAQAGVALAGPPCLAGYFLYDTARSIGNLAGGLRSGEKGARSRHDLKSRAKRMANVASSVIFYPANVSLVGMAYYNPDVARRAQRALKRATRFSGDYRYLSN